MTHRQRCTLLMSNLSIAFVMLGAASSSAVGKDPSSSVYSIEKVRPILNRRCVACHGPNRQEGGLRLDNREQAYRGGDSGPAILPRNAARSLLMERVESLDKSERMPLDKQPLRGEEIAILRKWIEAGAIWPQQDSSSGRVRSDHWSFQPVLRLKLPDVKDRAWVRGPIDTFVLAHLEELSIGPSPEADRATLVRRLHLDLLGLPPAPETVNAFLMDHRPDAFERLVSRLLVSPHFGERWAQPWLDLARYADSDGYEMDYPRENAWRWRDWLIQAINGDMPFDRFTVEQIAGDLLPDATWREKLATGFHRNTLTNTENGIDKEEFRVKAIVDRVNTTGTVWLGLTIGCAECHSHKYDPIRQREYYRLFAFFNDQVDESEIEVEPTAHDQIAFRRSQQRHDRELQKLNHGLEIASADQRDTFEKRLADLRKRKPELRSLANVFQQRRRPRETHVHLRGNFLDPGSLVQPGVPAVLPRLGEQANSRYDRIHLARWLVDGRNPLTARVEVNRIWQQLFGVGLVATPGDFGTQGERPSHPLLLDWLASELTERGWSRKEMVRLIVKSATYRQASALRTDLANIDPTNGLLARQNRYRLDAEFVRDQYLAVSGQLNSQIGGPSFHPPLPTGMSQIGFKVAWKVDSAEQLCRRGMYIVTRRNLAFPMLSTFDRPDANVTCVERERSNSPLQSLTQMNDPLMMDCARALARRILSSPLEETNERIALAFGICLSRPPTNGESDALASLHQRLRATYRDEPDAAKVLVGGTHSPVESVKVATWVMLARTIMNLDEFVTRE